MKNIRHIIEARDVANPIPGVAPGRWVKVCDGFASEAEASQDMRRIFIEPSWEGKSATVEYRVRAVRR